VKELAERWRVTDRAVQKWINKGEFPNAYRVGMGRGSHFRIPVSDVMAFEKARRVVRQEG
jgi:excisionase family DNA binding protein